MKLIINGINGAMGQSVLATTKDFEEIEVVAGIDKLSNNEYPFPIYSDIEQCEVEADVVIDFSNPKALDGIINYCKKTGTGVVVATTGHSESQVEAINELSKKVPVFKSANMSLGVNLQMNLVSKAAQLLYPDFEVEIIEKHHNKKLDAPSGTALALADSINESLDNQLNYVHGRHSKTQKRERNEMGIHAIRGGTIVGEHTVLFIGNDEVIEITHKATSKKVFAIGAVRAGLFIAGKNPGLYSMKDVVSE